MALLKEITTRYGITANYWVINEFNVDRSRGSLLVEIVPYVSQEAREAGASPIMTDKITVRVEDVIYPEGSENESIPDYTDYFSPEALDGKDIYTVMYEYIRTHIGQFENAENV